ncbi:hypothetical protein ES703_113267 [subsurface metagenome]
MAQEEEYLSYEQVLQELQIDRRQLNQLIRDGRLGEHVVEGETKFRLSEAEELKKALEKRPTVMEGEEAALEEVPTDVLEAGEVPPTSAEPDTEILIDEAGERETDLLEETPPRALVERETEILEEAAEEVELEGVGGGEEIELEELLAEGPTASETALETDLELEVAPQPEAEEVVEEDFFDFGEGGELKLEEPAGAALEVPAVEEEEDEEIVTDVLELGVEEEVPEEDLLSEIMEIEEEEAPEVPLGDETDDITAEITTMEEPTYEDTDLEEVLGVDEELEFGEGVEEAEEFEVPYAAPVAEAQVSGWVAGVLVLTLVLLIVAGLFVVENAFRPDFATHLTGWAPFGP